MEHVASKTTNRPAPAAQVTAFTAGHAAVRQLERQLNKLSKAHDAAQVAEFEARKERTIVPPPPILTIHNPPITLVIEGETRQTEAFDYTYRTEREIAESDDLTDERKAAMLQALGAWKTAQQEADEASGFARVAAAEQAASEASSAGFERLIDAVIALLRIPTSDPAEVAIKRKLIDKHCECDEDMERVIPALLDAACGAPPPAAPPSPQGGDDAELIALDAVLTSLITEEDRRRRVHNERMTEAHAKIEAACSADPEIPADRERFAKLWIAVEQECQTHKGDADVEVLHADFDRIRERSTALRATTLDGLRVKARLAAWYNPGFDQDNMEVSSLIRDVAALTGAPAPEADYSAEDLMFEYETIGGKLMLGPGGLGLHIAYPAQMSTRAREIEVAITRPEMAADLQSTLELNRRVLAASPPADEDALANSRPEDREPPTGPFEVPAAAETRAAGALRACPFCGERQHLHASASFDRPAIVNGAIPLRENGEELTEEVGGIFCAVCDAMAPLDVWNGQRDPADFAILRDFSPEPGRVAA